MNCPLVCCPAAPCPRCVTAPHPTSARQASLPRRFSIGAALVGTCLGLVLWWPAPACQAANAAEPWPAPIPGFVAPEPGEHPRLLFRRDDLPALRERAQTPEGRAILDRLRQTLGGGEAMPSDHRAADAPFGDRSDPIPQPLGAYSMGHAAGFGLLYQLTGEQRYADLGRQCFEWAFEGVRDRDDRGRYGWKGSSGALRAGPTLGWYALGYDLCYDGWDEDFRRQVALAFQDYNEGSHTSLAELARGSRHHPGSNHWGMQVGGAAMALLAIMNDPGVDMDRIGPLLEQNQGAMIRNMTQGFGDGGFFAEGDGTGSMSSHIIFLPALQAWQNAGGLDFVSPRPNAGWMAKRWLFLTKFDQGTPRMWPLRGGYPHNVWDRTALSGAGYFATGFGVVPDEFKPGLLWCYNRFLLEHDTAAGAPFDTVSVYPQFTVLSYVNWPFGTEPANPADAWPRAMRDSRYGFYAWRNRWQDDDDVVISILTRGARGFMRVNGETSLHLMLPENKTGTWGQIRGFTGDFEPADDGTTVLVTGDGSSLGIDFSGKSGCDALLVMTGPGAPAGGTVVEAGGRSFSFLLIADGEPPVPTAEGDLVVIGDRTIAFDGQRLVFGP